MGTVTFIKNGKEIVLPEYVIKYVKKIPGLYKIESRSDAIDHISFSDDIKQVKFDDFYFNNSLYFHLDNQELIFVDCVFNKYGYDFKNGSIEFIRTTFNFTDIYFDCCDKVLLSIIKQIDNSSITGFSKEFELVGIRNFIKTFDIKADKVVVDSCAIYTDCFEVITKELAMNDCLIESINSLSLTYSDLKMNDCSLSNKFDTIDFYSPDKNGNYRIVARYKDCITDKDLLDERKQTLYSLLSVLNGYNKKIQSINQSYLYDEKVALNEKRDNHLKNVALEMNRLEQKRNSIIGSFEAEQKKLVKKCENKKIKDIDK